MEKRSGDRVNLKTRVLYGTSKPLTHVSRMVNLSESGFFISTNQTFEPGTELNFIIKAGETYLNGRGVVVREEKVPQSLFASHSEYGMGIRFTEVNQELLSLYRSRKT